MFEIIWKVFGQGLTPITHAVQFSIARHLIFCIYFLFCYSVLYCPIYYLIHLYREVLYEVYYTRSENLLSVNTIKYTSQ